MTEAHKEPKTRSTRDVILDAAVELFVRDGFEKTPMDAIAEAAHVAKGTLYYHYDSKEGIVDAILACYGEALKQHLTALESRGGEVPLERLAAIVLALKEVNSATFSRLHRIRYIDIHVKTVRVMIDVCAPFLARLLEVGREEAGWLAEYPLETSELLLSASMLFDPEIGGDRSARQGDAFATLLARSIGIDVASVQQALLPVAPASRGRARSGRGGRR